MFGGVLQKWSSYKFHKIRRKTPVLESLFLKKVANLLCATLSADVFLWSW